MATGGSTNAGRRLLAVAKEAGVQLDIDEFDRISRRTPLLADMKPWGSYTAPEMHEAGGMPVVAKRLLEAGLLNEKEMTVSGDRKSGVQGKWRIVERRRKRKQKSK